MDMLVARTLLVSMVKNKSWHSNLIVAVNIRKYKKQGEISSEYIRSKLHPMAIFSTKKSSHMGAFFRSQCPLAIRFLALAHITSSETIFYFNLITYWQK